MKWIFAVTTGAVLALSSADTIGLHGSGTTNPSKCLWMLASQLMDRTLGPSSMTYSGNDDQPASRSDTIPVFPAVSLRFDALVALLKSEPSFSNATVISFVSLEKKSLMSGGSLH